MKYIEMTPPAECAVTTRLKTISIEDDLQQVQWKIIVKKWKQQESQKQLQRVKNKYLKNKS
jgi:hypothetical protein